MNTYTNDNPEVPDPLEVLGSRLDNVRALLNRTDLSGWARTYWASVEHSLQRKWTASTLNITGRHVSCCF
jgi:hypothetical protein